MQWARAGAVHTLHLFAPLHEELLDLLNSLRPDDWIQPTSAGDWTVKDVAAHLLDGQLRRLSLARDKHLMPGAVPADPAQLGDWINRVNHEWIAAAQRISPRVLIGLLAWSGPRLLAYFETLDPEALAEFPVGWAGESDSRNWFDVAREYTEHWHHQQQIRDAVGAAPLTGRRWLYPVFETFVRALPYAYHATSAAHGTVVRFAIEGDAGGAWSIGRTAGKWVLLAESGSVPAASIRVPQDLAWRLFTKGARPSEVQAQSTADGPEELIIPAFNARAVMG